MLLSYFYTYIGTYVCDEMLTYLDMKRTYFGTGTKYVCVILIEIVCVYVCLIDSRI